MTSARNEEMAMNPLMKAKDGAGPFVDARPFPVKEILASKVLPLEETSTKNNSDKVLSPFESALKIKGNQISVSNEDLKAIYEKKKNQKGSEAFQLEKPSENSIVAIALAHNKECLVSAYNDGSIKMFDLETKQQIYHFENVHESSISSLFVTRDNKHIVSGSYDRSIKVFDFETKKLAHHFVNADESLITAAAGTYDGRYIVSGSFEGSIKVFDIETKQHVHTFPKAHRGLVSSIVITSDDRYIISGSEDKTMKMFDLQAKEQVPAFENAHLDEVNSVALAPNNKLIVSGCRDKSVKVFDLETRQQVHHFENAHENGVACVTFTRDSRYVISGAYPGSIKIFDLEIKKQVHHMQKVQDSPGSMVVTSDNKFLICGSLDGSIKGFELETKHQIHKLYHAHLATVSSVVVTSGNKYFVSASEDKSIKIFDLETKKLIHHISDAHTKAILAMTVTLNDKFIISASESDIKAFDFETRQQVHHFENQGPVRSLAATPDSRFIIAGSRERFIKVFDLQAKQQVHCFETESRVLSVAVMPNNKYILSGFEDGSIKLYDFRTKTQVHDFKNAHQGEVTVMAATHDSKFVISGSADKSMKMFDIETKQLVYHFENIHENAVSSVIVTSDNRYIISGANAQPIKVFDLETKQQVHQFPKIPYSQISTVAVASDNSSIVSNFYGGSLFVLDFDLKQKEPGFTGPDCKDKALLPIQDRAIFDQELYFTYKGIKQFSIFNSADSFLFDKSTEFSISEAVKLPDLVVLPFRWNILHIVSIYANHDFIENMPEYSQLKMPFLLDVWNRTPLHYLIAHKNVNSITANLMFRYICAYLEDCYSRNPFEFQKIIESLDSLLPFILQKVDMKTRQKFLRLVDSKSPTPFRNPAPVFGNILTESACFCDSPVLTQETRDKIWNEEGTTQLEFRSNFLHLDYDIVSQDMGIMVDCLKSQEGEEVFKMPVIMRLIDHLWRQAATPLLIFFALYSAFIIALSVYLTFDDRSLAYEIVLLAISAVLTANEFWQVFHLRMSYLESLWNWVDLTQLLLTIAFLITRIADNENELARAWISTIIVLLGYIRWISLLKIFKPTRNLIQVVLTILKDMLSFVIIIALIIIAFSLIFLVFNREAGYGDYLYEAYNVMYGPQDIEDGAAWPFSQKLLMAALAFFLNVVLLNLLISIMGDSYGQVLEMRDRTDALTRLEMISEAMIYKKFFKMNHQTKRGYLVYCLPVEWEEDENEQELENNLKTIKKTIQQNSEDSKQELQIVKNQILTLTQKMSSLEETILNEFSKLKTTSALINKS